MIKVTEPFEGTVEICFSTGLRVSIVDKTKDSRNGKPCLYINAAGHGKDGGHDTIFIRPEAANSFTIFFNTFQTFESQL